MKMDIKLIALDLDGTLLDSQKRLSDRNREVLLRCAQQGIEIVPCTGRIWMGVPEFIRSLPGVHYAITVNGAVVEDVARHQVLDEKKLSNATAIELMELAQQFHTMYDVYIGGKGYGEKRFLDHMGDYGAPTSLQRMILDTRQPVQDLVGYVRQRACPVEKINCFFGDQEVKTCMKAELAKRDDIIVSASFPSNIEINALGATKGDGIARLAAHLGISQSQTMGFGDGENDITMMETAGIGIAMGNGMAVVKACADYVTGTNDEDGVAAALEHFILEA